MDKKKLALLNKLADTEINKHKAKYAARMEPYMRVNSEKSIHDMIVATERLKYYQKAINDMFEWLNMMED